jgi:small subunit ribosomal protein S6
MPLYELGVIIDPEAAPEDETAALARFEAIITKAGGQVVARDPWGRRQLAYAIKKRHHGIYHFWKFEVTGEALAPLTFELRTNDLVLRSLTLNLDRELRRKRKGERRDKVEAAKRAARAEAQAVADEEAP